MPRQIPPHLQEEYSFIGPDPHYPRGLILCLHCKREINKNKYLRHVRFEHPGLMESKNFGLANKMREHAHKPGWYGGKLAGNRSRTRMG